MTFATINGWGGQQGETVGVTVPGAWSGEPHRPLTTCCRTPSDGRIVLHKRLQQGRREREREKDGTQIKYGAHRRKKRTQRIGNVQAGDDGANTQNKCRMDENNFLSCGEPQ